MKKAWASIVAFLLAFGVLLLTISFFVWTAHLLVGLLKEAW